MDRCDHERFRADVAVQRNSDSAVWYAGVKVKCEVCGQQMQFLGLPMGLSPSEPMTDVNGTEARLPFRPYSEEETRRRFLNEHPAGYTISAHFGEDDG